MSNKNGKPPVPSKDLNSLQGLNMSKIDFYNLGHIVQKLRESTDNISLIDIANELNTKHLPEGAPKISTMAVQRWCKSNLSEDSVRDLRTKEQYAINTYHQEIDLMQTIDNQISNLEIFLDALNKEIKKGSDVKVGGKEVREMMFALEKMIARKSALLTSVKATQDKIFTFVNFQEIINRIMGKIKEKDLVLYAEIVESIKEDLMLQEFYRKIQPEK